MCHWPKCAAFLAFGSSLLFQPLVAGQPWQDAPGFRFTPLRPAPIGLPGFSRLQPQDTGIDFTNHLPESQAITNTILPNGSGVAAGDIDGDGHCDLFFAGLGGASRLYRNRGQGTLKFQIHPLSPGLSPFPHDATGALLADVNADGHLDLLVSSIGGGTRLFFNDSSGSGRFLPSPRELNPSRGGTSLALADATGSGRFDLYVANYRLATIMDAPGTRFTMRMVNGRAELAQVNGRPPTDPE